MARPTLWSQDKSSKFLHAFSLTFFCPHQLPKAFMPWIIYIFSYNTINCHVLQAQHIQNHQNGIIWITTSKSTNCTLYPTISSFVLPKSQERLNSTNKPTYKLSRRSHSNLAAKRIALKYYIWTMSLTSFTGQIFFNSSSATKKTFTGTCNK